MYTFILSLSKGHPEPVEGWFDKLTMVILSLSKDHPEPVEGSS